MKKPKTSHHHHHTNATNRMEPEPKPEEPETEQYPFNNDTDICQQLMSRYAASTAPQHRHLVATAAAMRSVLTTESLPLTPQAYFAASINSLSENEGLDCTEIGALLSFVSVLAPLLVQEERGGGGGDAGGGGAIKIKGEKAREVVRVLVGVVREKDREGGLSVSSVRGVVKCLGVLVSGFCDLEDWECVRDGFEALVKFSIDKRPKVRKNAQDCLEKVFKSFESSSVIKEASKFVLSLLKSYTPQALTLSKSRTSDFSKGEAVSDPEHLEVLHTLNLLNITIPYLYVKIESRILSELLKLISSQFSTITRHIFRSLEVFFETSSNEVIRPHLEHILDCLSSYVLLGDKNPLDTLTHAATLLRNALKKLHVGQSSSSFLRNVPKVFGSISGLLMYSSTAPHASDIMKQLVSDYVDTCVLSKDENKLAEDGSYRTEAMDLIKSLCAILQGKLISSGGIPNEHLLGVVSVLFQKLGDVSSKFMENIILKLAEFMNYGGPDTPEKIHLRSCIGSAVAAMGAEKILTLIPISFNTDDFTCSNTWLVPILKDHVVGASLGYYIEHIEPLAKLIRRASRKVKKSVIGRDLQAHAHGLQALLPAFCRYPVDIHKKFESLAALMISFLKDSAMHQNIAIALQALVSQDTSVLSSNRSVDVSNSLPSYSKDVAKRNIRALASCATELLQALVDKFVDSIPEKRLYLKDAIISLASVTGSSVTKGIFVSLLKRFQFVNDGGEVENLNIGDGESIGEDDNGSGAKKVTKRVVIMDLASSLIDGADKDLVDLIYNLIITIFKATDLTGHCEAYYTLSRILEKHPWFCSSRLVELVNLLLKLKSPTDVLSLENRLACLRILMVHTLEISSEEEKVDEEDEEGKGDSKPFLILNEVILALKDGKEDNRKVAYGMLLALSSDLRNSSRPNSVESYRKLINMIMGYLSGSSPQIKSGAVSALSVLVYNDTDICLTVPDLVPTLLSLLQSKAVEVIKAVLGFVKVLVSSLDTTPLQNLLSDVISGVLPWSSISRHHFRSKVTVILEILTRKCGPAAVEFLTPEKYKNFVKTVLQNRRHKPNPKAAETTEMEAMPADSSTKRPGKRKQAESPSGFEQNASSSHQRKRKWGKKQDESFNRPHNSRISAREAKQAKIFRKGQTEDGMTKRKFDKEPTNIRKRKTMEHGKMGKSEKAKWQSSDAFKFRKQKKIGIRQKT